MPLTCESVAPTHLSSGQSRRPSSELKPPLPPRTPVTARPESASVRRSSCGTQLCQTGPEISHTGAARSSLPGARERPTIARGSSPESAAALIPPGAAAASPAPAHVHGQTDRRHAGQCPGDRWLWRLAPAPDAVEDDAPGLKETARDKRRRQQNLTDQRRQLGVLADNRIMGRCIVSMARYFETRIDG